MGFLADIAKWLHGGRATVTHRRLEGGAARVQGRPVSASHSVRRGVGGVGLPDMCPLVFLTGYAGARAVGRYLCVCVWGGVEFTLRH